jgi:type VI secretion system secreted protein VgrG
VGASELAMAKDKFAQVKSPLGDKLLLRGVQGREELGRPFSYTLDLLSEDESINPSSILGQDMTIKLSLEDESDRCIHGIVTRFSATGSIGRYTRYGAQLRPWIWLLSHTSDCRIFQNETIPDIIKTVFRDLGFTDVDDALTGTYKPLEYVVQYRESAFNFVTRLMERAGIYYFFTHEESKHSLVLADSASAHGPAKGYEEVPYYPPEVNHARDHDHFDGWALEHQFRTGVFAVNDFDFKRPSADLNAKSSSPRDHAKSDLEYYDYPGEYIEVEDGETFAKLALQAHQAEYEQVRGKGNARGLGAGHLFTLKNFKRSDQNREYLIVSVDCKIQVKGYESQGRDSAGSTYEASMLAIDSKADFRLAHATPKPTVAGPQTAIVTGKDGEEIWTDEHGRVKLQFHWDRVGKSNEESSCWVRVAQLWAGSGWGGMYVPRIGQEVVVEFLDGDPDRPLVTGCVYNGNNRPPQELPGKASQSGIKSRSTKGANPDDANEIRFEDKKGEEELFIRAQKDFKEVVKHDHSLVIDGNQKVEVKGEKTELSLTGKYKVDAGKTIDFAATESITLKWGQSRCSSRLPESSSRRARPRC